MFREPNIYDHLFFDVCALKLLPCAFALQVYVRDVKPIYNVLLTFLGTFKTIQKVTVVKYNKHKSVNYQYMHANA